MRRAAEVSLPQLRTDCAKALASAQVPPWGEAARGRLGPRVFGARFERVPVGCTALGAAASFGDAGSAAGLATTGVEPWGGAAAGHATAVAVGSAAAAGAGGATGLGDGAAAAAVRAR